MFELFENETFCGSVLEIALRGVINDCGFHNRKPTKKSIEKTGSFVIEDSYWINEGDGKCSWHLFVRRTIDGYYEQIKLSMVDSECRELDCFELIFKSVSDLYVSDQKAVKLNRYKINQDVLWKEKSFCDMFDYNYKLALRARNRLLHGDWFDLNVVPLVIFDGVAEYFDKQPDHQRIEVDKEIYGWDYDWRRAKKNGSKKKADYYLNVLDYMYLVIAEDKQGSGSYLEFCVFPDIPDKVVLYDDSVEGGWLSGFKDDMLKKIRGVYKKEYDRQIRFATAGRYADNQLSKVDLIDFDTGVNHVGLDEIINNVYLRLKSELEADTNYFCVGLDGSLCSLDMKPYVRQSVYCSELSECLLESDEDEGNQKGDDRPYIITNAFYKFLCGLDSWKDIAGGRFEEEMAKEIRKFYK